MTFKKIEYSNLNARQKENFNFQMVAATLAEYGYSCMWLNDDWQGADFIANHINGTEFLKVQLKSRLSIYKKYVGKNIHIAFRYMGDTYIYPHDEVMNMIFENLPTTARRNSWLIKGGFSWPNPMSKMLALEMEKYKLQA